MNHLATTQQVETNNSASMPSFEQMYAFLREHYLHSRFEGRNAAWSDCVPKGCTYSELIARSALEYLGEHEAACIGQYESASGRVIWYDSSLTILNPDEPRAQIQRPAPSLGRIIHGQSW